MSAQKGRVTGVGGIFFKSTDPKTARAWYGEHLGLPLNEYGALFEFRDAHKPERKGSLQWGPFPENTKYFEPSRKEFMVNFRVENLDELLASLREKGIQMVGEVEAYDFGRFAHIMDPEGNKIELWEPIDEVSTDSNAGETTN